MKKSGSYVTQPEVAVQVISYVTLVGRIKYSPKNEQLDWPVIEKYNKHTIFILANT
jgi:hypothetical protein